MGQLPLWFVVGSVVLFAGSSVISYVAQCSYDDIPNLWSCTQIWAVPVMEYFDPIIFLVAYPALFIGVILEVFRVIRSKLRRAQDPSI